MNKIEKNIIAFDRNIKILHWPSCYPDLDNGKPYDCIFVKEHIQALSPWCKNRIVFISSDELSGWSFFKIVHSIENGNPTDRLYFKTIRPLWITNIYLRIVLFFYFIHLIFVKKYYPDILHVHFHQAGLMAMLFCKIFRIKMVVTEHWSAFIGWPELPEARFKKAARVFDHAKWVFTVSRKIKVGIEERTGVSLNFKYSTTFNSVDANLFFLRSNLIINKNNKKRILCVARLAEEKDFPNLFLAISFLKKLSNDFECEVIGKGNPDQFSPQLLGLAIDDKVFFTGEKPKTEIAESMKTADVLVVSSFIENSPCVIGEALCTGLPVVSTNVGGIPELIDDNNGILVPPSDPQKLAHALYEALYERNFDRETISKKAQALFSYNAIGHQIFSAYQKVLGQPE